jgi:hypothetical protein
MNISTRAYFNIRSSAFPFNHEMAMEEKAAVFLKVRTHDGLAPKMLGIEGRGRQDDVLAVETSRRSGESTSSSGGRGRSRRLG